MKSPILYFLPAALGAAGMYWLIQPGPQVSVFPDRPGVPRGAAEGEGENRGADGSASRESRNSGGMAVSPGDRRSAVHPGNQGPRSAPGVAPTHPATASGSGSSGGSWEGSQSRLSRAELVARAAQVEIEANRELARLIPALGLTETQQQRIFGVLVRHSPEFHPVMQIESDLAPGSSSSPAGVGLSKEDDLYAALDAGQQVVLEEIYEDQSAWWQDVVEQLVGEDDIPNLPAAEPPMMADEKPAAGPASGKDVTGTVRPPSS